MAIPASAMPDSAPADILEAFEELAVPAGYRAELIEREIVVSPPPDGEHEQVISRIAEQVFRSSATRVDASGDKGTKTPFGRLIPDLAVGARGTFGAAESWMPAEGLILVVEVTSSRPQRDREQKRRAYAGAQIPLYLLVDRCRGEVLLYSDPEGGDYRGDVRVPLGKRIELPSPFSFTLDTAEFG